MEKRLQKYSRYKISTETCIYGFLRNCTHALYLLLLVGHKVSRQTDENNCHQSGQWCFHRQYSLLRHFLLRYELYGAQEPLKSQSWLEEIFWNYLCPGHDLLGSRHGFQFQIHKSDWPSDLYCSGLVCWDQLFVFDEEAQDGAAAAPVICSRPIIVRPKVLKSSTVARSLKFTSLSSAGKSGGVVPMTSACLTFRK